MNHDSAPEDDSWVPEDPDELPSPAAMVAYWKTANRSPEAQQRLVADRWRLWRLARDMAAALEGLLGAQEAGAR